MKLLFTFVLNYNKSSLKHIDSSNEWVTSCK